MNAVRIEGVNSPLYQKFLDIYEASFPESERRDVAGQAAAFADPRYRLDAWLDGTRFVALMGWWDFGDFRYIEHVAVAPSARSGGYGGRVLQSWLKQSPRPVYLEIEEVTDEMTARRRNFYLRLGFAATPFHHLQPAYQGEGPPVAMQVLTWPEAIDAKEHERFFALLEGQVWAHPLPQSG